jgi:hypothetical protein
MRISGDGPALALEGELDLRGKSKLRALACSPLAIIAVVLIVLIIVAGKVLIAWHDGAQREDLRRPASGRCTERTERIERIERIERTCERDGSAHARSTATRSTSASGHEVAQVLVNKNQ